MKYFAMLGLLVISGIMLGACSDQPAAGPTVFATESSLASGEAAPTEAVETWLPTEPVLTDTPTPTLPPPPTPTPTPPPTALPEAQLFVFDFSHPEMVSADLLEHLFFFSQGGAFGPGGGGAAGSAYWVYSYANEVRPAVPQTLRWFGCDFTSSAEPQVVFTRPDGSQAPLIPVEEQDLNGRKNCVSVRYKINPGALFGTYTMVMKRGSEELSDAVTLVMPDAPIHTEYEGNDWFAGFQPGENITVSFYTREDVFNKYTDPETEEMLDDIFELAGIVFFLVKQEVIQADAYGSFQIEIITDPSSETIINLSVTGEISGNIPGARYTEYPQFYYGEDNAHWFDRCGELPVRLEVGMMARVTEYGAPLESLSSMDPRRVLLPAGTVVKILLGPFCMYDSWAWLAESTDGNNERMVLNENSNVGYFLEPVVP